MLAAGLVWTGGADAFTVGDGTAASGLGPVGWHLEARIAGHSRKYALVSQDLVTSPSWEDHPENTGESDSVLVRHHRLAIGAGGQYAPVVEQQLYSNDRAGPGVNIAGVVTNAGVRRLELRYGYSAARPPTTAGVERLVLRQPIRRKRLDHTPLKFWLAAATGGAGGYPYHITRIRGRVRVCSHGSCRLRWRLLYRG